MDIYMYVLLVILGFLHRCKSDDHIIHTTSGSINGILNQYGQHNVYQFRNIPYAKPPIGDLRFRRPQPYGNWPGIRNGAYFGPSCIQDMRILDGSKLENGNMSEDCLSLNVYVPCRLPQSGQGNRSVMTWVHGGGFQFGQGEYYDPSALAIHGDVIVVTINYRLGLFGFLSTEDDASRGNYGLWDQHLAFKWVKNNIGFFGGDPNSITIFGESAGGWSVSLQSLSTHNKGLFKRVIAQSGVANCEAAVTNEGLYFAKKYGALLGCINATNSNINTTSLVSCLRKKSSDELLSAQLSTTLERHDRFRFRAYAVPVVDGEFLVDYPKNILRNRNSDSYKMFKSLDFMTGNCNTEGSLLLESLEPQSNISHFNLSFGVPTTIVCDYYAPSFVQELYPDSKETKYLSDAVCNKYRSTDPVEQARKVIDLCGDVEFIVPAVEKLNSHSVDNNSTRTYQYIFNRPFLFPANLPPWFHGSSHASELPYLFDLNISVPQEDQTLIKAMLGYWTNFAKTGDPNGANLLTWPPYDGNRRSYINLDTQVTQRNHVFNDRVQFWTKDIPNAVSGLASVPVVIGK